MSQKKRSAQIDEILKCGQDPLYFIRTYLEIQHPTKGRIQFELYPFQEDVINNFLTNRYNIILKSRQLGLTTVTSAYCLWLALFHKDKNILLIADNFRGSKNMLAKIKVAWRGLPAWMLEVLELTAPKSESATVLELTNGSKIEAFPTTEDTARGQAASFVVVDEAAINAKLEEGWKSILSTTTEGGSIVVFSTPRGKTGQFYKLWIDAEAKRNNFVTMKLPWHVHPFHDQAWFDAESKNMDDRQMAQELNCVGGDTKILTPHGYSYAKDICVGDEVLTHTGTFKRVKQTQARHLEQRENLYQVSTPCNRQDIFYITGNHPVLSIKTNVRSTGGNAWDQIKIQCVQPSWNTLDELIPFDKNANNRVYGCLHPINNKQLIGNIQHTLDLASLPVACATIGPEKVSYWRQRTPAIPRFVKIDENLGRFIGLAVAEGCIIKNTSPKGAVTETLQLAFHVNELDTLGKFVEYYLDELGVTYTRHIRQHSECFTLSTCNKFIIACYRHFVTDGKAHEKRLRLNHVLACSEEFVRGYLIGHYDGDGDHPTAVKHNNQGNKLKLVSASSKLLQQVRILLGMYGLYPRVWYHPSGNSYIELDGLESLQTKTIQEVMRVGKEVLEKPTSRTRNFDDYVVGMFQTKQVAHSVVNGVVYNIEVEEDHSYVVQGLIVHNCSFEASGNTFFNQTTIDAVSQGTQPPVMYGGPHQKALTDLHIWKVPVPDHKYIICADIARGDAEDFSGAEIIDMNTWEQTSEYLGKIPPDRYGEYLVELGYRHNTALIVQEKNSIGLATAIKLRDLKYPNLYWPDLTPEEMMLLTPEELAEKLPGFTTKPGTQPGSREQILSNLEEILRNKKLKIYSARFAEQMSSFNWTGKRGQAAKGRSDDLIMALAIGCYVAPPQGSFQSSVATEGTISDWHKAFLASFSTSKRSINTSLAGFGQEPQTTPDPFTPQPTVSNQFMAPRTESYNGVKLKPGVRRDQVAADQYLRNSFAWMYQ